MAGSAAGHGPQLRVQADRLVERPTILVLHSGPGFDQGYLRPGLGALNGEARVVFVDLRGQGRSGRPPLSTCTLEQMADDVAELCAQLGIDAPVLFGHSAGGFVALHLALRHPGLAGGFVLCETAPTLAPLPDDNPPAGLAERAPAESIAAAARLFGGGLLSREHQYLCPSGCPVLRRPPAHGHPSALDVADRLRR